MVDIFLCGFMDFADGFFGGWVDGLESLAILAFNELVVDEAAFTRVSTAVCGLERVVGAARYRRIRCGVKADGCRNRHCQDCNNECLEVKESRYGRDSQSSGLLVFACCRRF